MGEWLRCYLALLMAQGINITYRCLLARNLADNGINVLNVLPAAWLGFFMGSKFHKMVFSKGIKINPSHKRRWSYRLQAKLHYKSGVTHLASVNAFGLCVGGKGVLRNTNNVTQEWNRGPYSTAVEADPETSIVFCPSGSDRQGMGHSLPASQRPFWLSRRTDSLPVVAQASIVGGGLQRPKSPFYFSPKMQS